MFLKYQLDWIKVVDFLLMAKFLASANNFGKPSTWNAVLRSRSKRANANLNTPELVVLDTLLPFQCQTSPLWEHVNI